MKTDAEKWFKEDGEKVLKDVGIKRGDIVLDFGCGEGTYSLPAAKIAGKEGKVFALDKSIGKLDDILHSYYFSVDERKKLLEEVHRALKPGGLLSVYPERMNVEEIKKEIEKTNFHLEKKYFKTLIHEERYTRTRILHFRKCIGRLEDKTW